MLICVSDCYKSSIGKHEKKGKVNMIYIFGFTIIFTLIRQREKLLKSKKNLILYLLLSIIGMAMGILYLINPYLPSISLMMEKYME